MPVMNNLGATAQDAEYRRKQVENLIATTPGAAKMFGPVPVPEQNLVGMEAIQQASGDRLNGAALSSLGKAYDQIQQERRNQILSESQYANEMVNRKKGNSKVIGGTDADADIFTRANEIDWNISSSQLRDEANQLEKQGNKKTAQKYRAAADERDTIEQKFNQRQGQIDQAITGAGNDAARQVTDVMSDKVRKDFALADKNAEEAYRQKQLSEFNPNTYFNQRAYAQELEDSLRKGDYIGALKASHSYDQKYVGGPSAETMNDQALMQFMAMQPRQTSGGGNVRRQYLIPSQQGGVVVDPLNPDKNFADWNGDDKYVAFLQVAKKMNRADAIKQMQEDKKKGSYNILLKQAYNEIIPLMQSAAPFTNPREYNDARDTINRVYTKTVVDKKGNIKTITSLPSDYSAVSKGASMHDIMSDPQENAANTIAQVTGYDPRVKTPKSYASVDDAYKAYANNEITAEQYLALAKQNGWKIN